MSKQITKAFRVDAKAWANFVRSAESYGATPAELLREFVGHADAAMKGVESGRIRSFDLCLYGRQDEIRRDIQFL